MIIDVQDGKASVFLVPDHDAAHPSDKPAKRVKVWDTASRAVVPQRDGGR